MSSLVAEEGSFDLVQWDDQSQLLNQPFNYFNDGITDWLPEVGQSTPLPDLSMSIFSSRSFGTVLTDTADNSAMDKDGDVVTNSVATEDEHKDGRHKDTRTANRKGRGRPKLNLDGPQSLKEVRLRMLRAKYSC